MWRAVPVFGLVEVTQAGDGLLGVAEVERECAFLVAVADPLEQFHGF